MFRLAVASSLVALLVACQAPPPNEAVEKEVLSPMQERLAKYTSVRLATDVGALSESERAMIPHLIGAAQAMEGAYWQQAYGDRDELMASLEDEDAREFALINYGPWDRLANNEAFIEGVEAKPAGANFYPADMGKDELDGDALESLYTMVRRDEEGNLVAVPYSVFFEDAYGAAAEELRAAAELAEDPGLKRYLDLRADALLSNDYRASDMAWMDMKDNTLDIVIGPVETYEDQLFGFKAANESFVLVKDQEWSHRLSRYVTLLPELQKSIPVDDAYKQETPGLDSDLNVYDVVYYAGDANAGSKAIAVNLPNDEEVQLQKGTRRLQFKNAMRAKFDKILLPIVDVLIAEEQRSLINFDAFFSNIMFHEVAHGLGIKNTINGRGRVRPALQERASALEEAKADVLGLFMIAELAKQGELDDDDLDDNYVTFLASIFRSVRFGAANAHGRANLMQLSFLEEKGAFSYDADSRTYEVDVGTMGAAVNELAGVILKFQGDGDYEGLGEFMEKYQVVGDTLQQNLDRLGDEGIPVDVVFEQGADVLGL
ncbi:MAG: hypothetical protein BMS9Abin37_1489 [Acidobacteriota bacterium]|nr:MAG: hypothetical protein BMS9Abin37_1489 [Acidobacteriota bacterium]